jgi:ADP-heptose:LPS heptosyltransferase
MIHSPSQKSYALFVRNSYGDLLMTDPLIKFIKNLNHKNEITLFVDDKNFQLVEFMENIDNYYIIPSKGNKYLLFIYFGLKYRKNKYDVSIAAKTGVGSSNGFFQFFLGATERIAYVLPNKKWTDRLVNRPVNYSEELYENQHYALSVLQLLDNTFLKIPKAFYPKLNNHFIRKINDKPKLLVSVSNNRATSLLNNSTIASIINKLSTNFDFDLCISCLKSNKDKAIKLQNIIKQKSMVHSSLKLEKFISLLGESDICLLGDGGSMHIAAALGIDQIVLFGETSEITWAPISEKAIVLRDDLDVNNIPEAQIFEALKKKLIQVSS